MNYVVSWLGLGSGLGLRLGLFVPFLALCCLVFSCLALFCVSFHSLEMGFVLSCFCLVFHLVFCLLVSYAVLSGGCLVLLVCSAVMLCGMVLCWCVVLCDVLRRWFVLCRLA